MHLALGNARNPPRQAAGATRLQIKCNKLQLYSKTSQIKTQNVHFRFSSLVVSRINQQTTKVSRDICLAPGFLCCPWLYVQCSPFPSLPSHGWLHSAALPGQAERSTQGTLLPSFLRKLSFSRWQKLICWDNTFHRSTLALTEHVLGAVCQGQVITSSQSQRSV